MACKHAIKISVCNKQVCRYFEGNSGLLCNAPSTWTADQYFCEETIPFESVPQPESQPSQLEHEESLEDVDVLFEPDLVPTDQTEAIEIGRAHV